MLFAESFFIRDKVAPTAPIFALAALESKRRIAVDDSDNVSDLIRKHYSELENGICSIWGIVQFYNHYHDGKCDVYSVSGEYLKTVDEKRPSNGASVLLT